MFSDCIAVFNFCSGLALTAPCHSRTQREQETAGVLGCTVRGGVRRPSQLRCLSPTAPSQVSLGGTTGG